MRIVLCTIGLCSVLLGVSPALAHDTAFHKGAEGQVIAVEPGRFLLRTDTGNRAVIVEGQTEIEINGILGERDDLKTGQHATVFGTRQPDGDIVAKKVIIHWM